jgi:hypothetical protein
MSDRNHSGLSTCLSDRVGRDRTSAVIRQAGTDGLGVQPSTPAVRRSWRMESHGRWLRLDQQLSSRGCLDAPIILDSGYLRAAEWGRKDR